MATTKSRDSRLENLQTSKRKEIDFCRKCGKSFKTSDLVVRRSIYYCKECAKQQPAKSMRTRICEVAGLAFGRFKQLDAEKITITRTPVNNNIGEYPPYAVVVIDLQSQTVQSVNVYYSTNHVSYKVKE